MSKGYLTYPYPDAFDFEALQGVIRGDLKVKAKAAFYLTGFFLAAYPGETNTPIVASNSPENYLNSALFDSDVVEPFTIEDIDAFAALGQGKHGIITDAMFLAKLAATLRKYIPEVLDFLKRVLM